MSRALVAPAEAPTSRLEIKGLSVRYPNMPEGSFAVWDVSLTLEPGTIVGLAGESGCGKSTTAKAAIGFRQGSERISGSSFFGERDLIGMPASDRRRLWGNRLSYVAQSASLALNPALTVGRQLGQPLRKHLGLRGAALARRQIELFELVQISNPKQALKRYPFQFSGGQQQRVALAIALCCNPDVLILDEPTTGLDVTTQKAVMDLIVELTRARAMSTILITHDLGLAAAYCDRVVVMEKGSVVETAASRTIFTAPSHPYTRKLMRATPRPGVALRDLLPEDAQQAANGAARTLPNGAASATADNRGPLLVVEDLVKEYPRKRLDGAFARLFKRKGAGNAKTEARMFRAVDGIGFTVGRGESVGLVGESGCGKSTTSTIIMRLIDKTAGSIHFDGEDIGAIPPQKFARMALRKRIQMVFQDPTDSLNPRFTAERAIADPVLRLGEARSRAAVRARCEELARQVGLPVELLDRFPHQLSGGQKARVGIARAIALNPDLVILDEPTAALDVSVQAVVLNLLQDLKERLGMSYLFVSHDLNVVRLLCNRVIVMQAGRIVEEGPTERVLFAPEAEYTRELLAAIPRPPV